MIRIADNLRVARPVAAQPYYHMLKRVVEMEYLPAWVHFGVGAVAYSPLARGVLTGKYRGGVIPEAPCFIVGLHLSRSGLNKMIPVWIGQARGCSGNKALRWAPASAG
jgi:hypothetical protein